MNPTYKRNVSAKRWGTMILIVLLIVAVVGGIWGYNTYKMVQDFKAMGVPKATISTIKAELQEWRPHLSAVGTLRAVRGADISAEVAGIVDELHFTSGGTVKEGQLLLTLRANDDVARLNALKASADLAELSYKRDQTLLEAQAISQAQLETSAANLKNLKAQVAAQQALLAKKFVLAPFAGTIGVRAVDVGQYLQPGSKIVTLQALDPVFVDFYLPQQSLNQVVVGQKISAHTDSYPELSFDGEISAIDPKVDADTRNVLLRATLKNPQHKLLPGMYANVNIEVGETARYLTIPQNAISFNPYGETVFVVTTQEKFQAEQDAKAKAEGSPPAAAPEGAPKLDPQQQVTKQVFVTVGPTRGDQIAILKGLNEGDEVVSSGQLKLKNGAAVQINNTVQPLDDAHPKPADH